MEYVMVRTVILMPRRVFPAQRGMPTAEEFFRLCETS